VTSPLKSQRAVDFGPNSGEIHFNEFKYSYDFSVPEGTQVFAKEEGTIVRIVQHYTVAHLDNARWVMANFLQFL
jgi:hypothetical protein